MYEIVKENSSQLKGIKKKAYVINLYALIFYGIYYQLSIEEVDKFFSLTTKKGHVE